VTDVVKQGRPTDFLPRLRQTDTLYVCGAPPMVESVREIATRAGAVCYADPFVPNPTDDPVEGGVLARAMGWLVGPPNGMRERIAIESQQRQLALPPPSKRRDRPAQGYSRVSEAEARVRSHFGRQSA
jgi:hypothetical protein